MVKTTVYFLNKVNYVDKKQKILYSQENYEKL